MSFAEKIIAWYQDNKRSLPWRDIRDPYRIWLSEIMLQQTRVAQAIAYYQRFVRSFPDVETLAKAAEQEVLRLWQGLGYYSRARNLHASAKMIYFDLDNHFPSSYDTIIRLKGVGDYTASAIASFAFGEAKPVLDGNVYRFFARYFGIFDSKDTKQGRREIIKLLYRHIPKNNPAEFNQAIMEFGALQCLPQAPTCQTCPLKNDCYAFQNGKVSLLPHPKRKPKQRKRYFNYLVYRQNGEVLIRKRRAKDIWQNLFEFPLIETPRPYSLASLQDGFPQYFVHTNVIAASKKMKHILSHQELRVNFYILQAEKDLPVLKDCIRIRESEMKEYPFSRLILKFWEENIL
jgi:A/G-specific adenine glycosylase